MIYFLYDSVNNVVKIGKSKEGSLYSRLSSLQTGNVTKLDLLGIITGYTDKESELHLKFDKYRIRGEWFEYTEEIKNYIETNRIEYEIKCPNTTYNKEAKKRYEAKRTKINYNRLEDLFELDENSYILVSDMKEYLRNNGIINTRGGAITATNIAKHFNKEFIKTTNKKIKGKQYRVVKGLKIK